MLWSVIHGSVYLCARAWKYMHTYMHSISHLMKEIDLEFIETFHIFSMMG